MPVVSQSIIRPIVPVGASTAACALRYAVLLAERDRLVPRLLRGRRASPSGTSSASISSAAARCLRITRSIASAFGS